MLRRVSDERSPRRAMRRGDRVGIGGSAFERPSLSESRRGRGRIDPSPDRTPLETPRPAGQPISETLMSEITPPAAVARLVSAGDRRRASSCSSRSRCCAAREHSLLDDPGLGWHLRNIDAMREQGGWLREDPFGDPRTRDERGAAVVHEPVARRTALLPGVEVGRPGGDRRRQRPRPRPARAVPLPVTHRRRPRLAGRAGLDRRRHDGNLVLVERPAERLLDPLPVLHGAGVRPPPRRPALAPRGGRRRGPVRALGQHARRLRRGTGDRSGRPAASNSGRGSYSGCAKSRRLVLTIARPPRRVVPRHPHQPLRHRTLSLGLPTLGDPFFMDLHQEWRSPDFHSAGAMRYELLPAPLPRSSSA